MPYRANLRVVPTMDERAAYYHRRGTTVADEIRRPTLSDRLVVRAGLAVYRGLVWVHRKLRGLA